MANSSLYANSVAEVLQLEELDRNLYRGQNATSAQGRPALYGGQVAAQALMAAGLTVDPERHPHSMHGYFLRPGLVDRPVILRVDIDRDGGSFSARHVAAMQDGKVIFSMLASFQRGESQHTLDVMTPNDAAEIPPPDGLPERDADMLVRIREVTRTETVDGRNLYSDCMWVRTEDPLPDDPLTQACGVAYLSDFGSGFGRLPEPIGGGGPSLDHALWFHEPTRADDWLLLNMWPLKATSFRGLYEGVMRDSAGKLCVAIAQEHLIMRQPPAS